MNKIRLCVLFGGNSSEYEVSLSSAYSVLSNLNQEKYEIIPLGITRSGLWLLYSGDYEAIRDGSWCNASDLPRVTLDLTPGSRSLLVRDSETAVRRLPVDIALPILHGAYGEDGRVQGMLSSAGIPCVGCDSASSAVCMDKFWTKSVVRNTGIRQAECLLVRRDSFPAQKEEIAEQTEAKLGYPVFVKPTRSGSSVGVSKAKSRDQLYQALEIAFREDSRVLIEEAIVGKEIETAVLEEAGQLTVSDCSEIIAGVEFYDYEAKYLSNTSSYYIPARLPEEVRNRVRHAAEEIFRILDCRTLSRVDFFVTEDFDIVFNEINTLPGFTPISMYPKLMQHTGLSYSELLDRLISSALANTEE